MLTGTLIAHYGIKVLVEDTKSQRHLIPVAPSSGHVVGDIVTLEGEKLKRLQRKNYIERNTPFGPQIIAANLAGVGIVVSHQPKTPDDFIDLVILAARKQGLQCFIIATKADLPESRGYFEALKEVFADEITLVSTSKEGSGIHELENHLSRLGRCLLVGVSGAGKSSLINALFQEEKTRTGATSHKHGHGRHTTSNAFLYKLSNGAEIIDSPGVRDFAPMSVHPSEVAPLFAGFAKILEHPCRFNNCLHEQEPDCSIKEAVDKGILAPRRYETYLNILKKSRSFDARKK